MTAEVERAVVLRSLVPGVAIEVPGRTHRLLARVVFFGLTCVGLLAWRQLLELFGMPKPGLIAGLGALAIAEYLIRERRWFWTGVEEALWIGGAFALIAELPSRGTPESMLVIALACAVPGWRVRNPLFGAAAAACVVAYVEKRLDLGVVAALVIAAAAVFALLRTWRRPSTEWLFIAIAVGMPVVGRFFGDDRWRIVTIVLYAVYGAVVLVLAILRRHHALFFSGLIALGIAGGDVLERMTAPVEAKLGVAGGILLIGAWVVSRALRARTSGIVTSPAKLTSVDDEVQIAATVALPRPEFAEAPAQPPKGGGEFGGAGATGKY